MSQQGKRKSTKESSQPNKRVVLTHAQKHQLCLDSQKTPRLTQTELANLYNIKQNTVSDIFKKKDKWLFINSDSEESNKQREKQVHFPQVEEALSLWITNALSANLVINGDILREKAKFFAQQFEITRFSASNGAPLETLDEERNKLHEILKNYDLNDVFNCDETGLYWDLEPSKTLAQGIIKSFKAQYRKLIVRNRIEAYEISQELNKGVTPINICDAINFSKEAWDFVSQRTIVNCWRHTGILPQDEIDEGEENEDQADQEAYNEIELQELIDQLPYDDPIDAEEFLHIDDRLQVDGGLTDEEIVSIIKSNDDEPKTDPIEESPKIFLLIQMKQVYYEN
ncbi:unnamed protein product [Rhizophagus irregularis]|nr:unnamed protein product [Rhizophagus irregularis]